MSDLPGKRPFRYDRRGNVAILFAIGLVPLVLAAGGALDFISATDMKFRMQDAADAAALAGTRKLIFSPDSEGAETQARAFILTNNRLVAPPSAAVTADTAAGIVTVALSGQSPTNFLGLMGLKQISVSALAKAKTVPRQMPICLEALSPSASAAISERGSSSITANACDVRVNSISPNAVSLNGNGRLSASHVCIRGGVSGGKEGAINPIPSNCGTDGDPLGSMPAYVAPQGCDFTNVSVAKDTALKAGVYCGGLSIGGAANVSLGPGTYVMRNGSLSMSGGGSLAGDGVVFVLEGAAAIDLSGGGAVHLTAPSSGDLMGFVIYQSPNATPGVISKLSGSNSVYFQGVVYLPTQTLDMTGSSTASTPSPFSAFIADTFRMTGNSSINLGYDPTKATVPVPQALLTHSGTVALIQ